MIKTRYLQVNTQLFCMQKKVILSPNERSDHTWHPKLYKKYFALYFVGQFPDFWTGTTHLEVVNPYSSAVHRAFG
jgi:hypothetical protein